jgi:hypothetical protein
MALDGDYVGVDIASYHWQLLASQDPQHLGDSWSSVPRHFLRDKHYYSGYDGRKEFCKLCFQHLDP